MIYILYPVDTFLTLILTLQVVQVVPQWIPTNLIENPSILRFHVVRQEPHQILTSWVGCKLLLGVPSLKEVRTKPNLFHVGLMGVIREDLFDRKSLFSFSVFTQPHQREPTSTQELLLIELYGESVPKYIPFLVAHIPQNLRVYSLRYRLNGWLWYLIQHRSLYFSLLSLLRRLFLFGCILGSLRVKQLGTISSIVVRGRLNHIGRHFIG